ncbi:MULTISPECIES: LuxR C-terminal-related transcriptional regulator [Arthrobacter]|nr:MULTISPECIES: LuxR C-terminal-related transcriptional regulator [Arthrobacter]MBT8163441.1 helix-turn-helix transcriptional regulator [Arthrobacter sp. GN70]
MFEEEARRALEYARRGTSVRIVGGPGSGRSTVLQSVIGDFEKTGVEVFSLAGALLLQDTPFAGIGALGLDARVRLSGPMAVADVLAERLARIGAKAIVVDDIDLLDKESAAVIDIVQRRTQRPLVMTMGDKPLYSRTSVFTPARWPEAKIRLSPLRYDQVNKLLAQTLGAPPDVDLTSLILMKSAGNPRLVVRIAQSAKLSKRLVLREGQWSIGKHSLWNEYLQSTIEALLHGLSADELTALHTLAAVGARPAASLAPTIEADVLDELERRGLVAAAEDADNVIWVDISPPVIGDYFRDHHTVSSRKMLGNRIAQELESSASHAITDFPGPVATLLNELRTEAGAGTAATRHFQEQLRILEQTTYGLWERERNMSNAAAFLRFYWGGPIDPVRIEYIFNNTETADANPADHFFFTMTRALWGIFRGAEVVDVTGILKEVGDAEPEWKAEAEAFAIYLQASFDRIPADFDDAWEQLDSKHPESGVLPVIRGIVELYRFDPQAALEALDSAEGFEISASMAPFVHGLALHIAGRSDEALVYSLTQRTEARSSLNQFGFVAISYVAALALVQRGLMREADWVMSSVFALGRPGFLVSNLHDAMLRLAGLRSLSDSGKDIPSLGVQSRRDVADIGPLPGTGKAVYDLVSRKYINPGMFDEAAARVISEQLDRGFITEAVYASLFMLSLYPGPRTLEKTKRFFRKNGVTSHGQFLALASAVLKADYPLLEELLEHYERDSDLILIGNLLHGAAKRQSLEPDPCPVAPFQDLAASFNARFPLRAEYPFLDTGEGLPQHLSAREIEIAVLAGSHSNAEIASRLGISTRTVENHISRSLKKTGTTTRAALHELVRRPGK